MDENSISKLIQLTQENNEMLKKITTFIDHITNEEYINKHLLQEIINNVVADLFADMLLQPKGRGYVSQDEIKDIIDRMKI